MAVVYLGLGSNIAPYTHLPQALDTLTQRFGKLELSPVYESEAVGFKGANFLNLVARIDTTLTVGELWQNLRDIENEHGRDRSAPRFSGRTLDIDILTYDDKIGHIDGVQLPRDEIFKNAFVLLPFSELAPTLTPPGCAQNLAELWQSFSDPAQHLWRVAFHWPAA